MAVTHFRISELPIRVDIEVNNVPVVLNTAYPIAQQNQVSAINNTGFKSEKLDTFKYQLSIDNGATWSDPGTATVNEFVEENLQQAANVTISETLENQNNTVTLVPNTSTDRIVVQDSLNGNAELVLDGTPLSQGDVVFIYDFPLLSINNGLGGGEPYDEINFRCANHLGTNLSDLYKIILNVVLLAEVSFESRTLVYGNTVINGTGYYTVNAIDRILISKAYLLKQLKHTIAITSPMLTESIYNAVEIDLEERTANENFMYFKDADDKGQALIELRHQYVDFTGMDTSSQIVITLDEVDTDPAKVSVTDSYTSTFNISGLAQDAVGAVTLYRSSYETNGDIYAGYLDGSTIVIKKISNSVVTSATGLTNLETDWTNRYSLTYS